MSDIEQAVAHLYLNILSALIIPDPSPFICSLLVWSREGPAGMLAGGLVHVIHTR